MLYAFSIEFYAFLVKVFYIQVRRRDCRMTTGQQNTARSAKIYKPAKNAMQSGKARTYKWVLEFDTISPRTIDPIMGYTSVSDTQTQVLLTFDSSDDAIAYAERNNVEYRLLKPKSAKRRAMSYTDNFKYDRPQPWTH